jgi:hypothetical protein
MAEASPIINPEQQSEIAAPTQWSTGQTRHKNNNNLIIYKSSQLDKLYAKTYTNSSIDEEEKSVIH